MNIFYKNLGENRFLFKPDSCLVKDSKDFYLPYYTEGVILAPSLVLRINKSAKCVENKFAGRYFNEIYFGVNIYDYRLKDKESGIFDLAPMTIFDNSCYISDSVLNPEVNNVPGKLRLNIDNVEIAAVEIPENLNKEAACAVELISGLCSLKTGDLIYLQFGEFTEMRKNVHIILSLMKCDTNQTEDTLFDFKIR